MSGVTFEILKIAVTLCVLIITANIAPYFKALAENEKYAQITETVDAAVLAAEQSMKTADGAAKKAAVVSWVAGCIKKSGLEVTAEQVNSLIEAAVYALKHADMGN